MAAAAAISAKALMPRKANSNRPRTPIRRNIVHIAQLPGPNVPSVQPNPAWPRQEFRSGYSSKSPCAITSAGASFALRTPRSVQTSIVYCIV